MFLRLGEVFITGDQPPRKRRLLSVVVRVEKNKTLLQKWKRGRRDFPRFSSFASDRFSGGSKLRVATGFLFAARDAYRKHPVISNNLRRATPEQGIALAAFGFHLFVEGMTSKLASSQAKKESHH
jgi:hypothetical protein